MMAINRRNWLKAGVAPAAALLLAVAGMWGLPPRADAADPSLEDTLRFGLRARRPIEVQYVQAVAQLTEKGDLPRSYVLASFDYARKRRPHIPMPYFALAIDRKAQELGVDIGVPYSPVNE
jgi:hypothetical protein